tara:strand:- start:2 stop:553 length:552 start_codon:yes stop_codon:yes gene_type:complete
MCQQQSFLFQIEEQEDDPALYGIDIEFSDYHRDRHDSNGEVTHRTCIKCEKLLPYTAFALRSEGFRRTECKVCTNQLAKIRSDLRKDNPPPDEMNYQCPICLKYGYELQGGGGRNQSAWALDHCHETDTFRGYTCQRCNRGVFRDDIPTIQRYIDYLQTHEDKLKAGLIVPREGSKAWIAQQS